MFACVRAYAHVKQTLTYRRTSTIHMHHKIEAVECAVYMCVCVFVLIRFLTRNIRRAMQPLCVLIVRITCIRNIAIHTRSTKSDIARPVAGSPDCIEHSNTCTYAQKHHWKHRPGTIPFVSFANHRSSDRFRSVCLI